MKNIGEFAKKHGKPFDCQEADAAVGEWFPKSRDPKVGIARTGLGVFAQLVRG